MTLNEISEILKKCAIFADLSDKELFPISQLGHIETFRAGDIIHKEGSNGVKLYVLSKGQVSLEKKVDLGNSRHANVPVFVMRELPHRRLMGGWSTLVGEEHIQMCSAVCNVPTQVVSIKCSELKDVLNKNPEIRVKILEKLVLLLRDRIGSSYRAIEAL